MAGNKTEQDPASPQDARLTSLDERLKRAERVEKERDSDKSVRRVQSAGWLVAQNLIGMPAGGFLIGFLLDKLLGTAPWIALALMFVGFAGAVWDLMKRQGSNRS